MKLLVFETDKLEREFVLKGDIRKDIDTGSVQRGAGSISSTLDSNEFYETVLFIKNNYFEGDYQGYIDALDSFIEDLRKYKSISESTNLI